MIYNPVYKKHSLDHWHHSVYDRICFCQTFSEIVTENPLTVDVNVRKKNVSQAKEYQPSGRSICSKTMSRCHQRHAHYIKNCFINKADVYYKDFCIVCALIRKNFFNSCIKLVTHAVLFQMTYSALAVISVP